MIVIGEKIPRRAHQLPKHPVIVTSNDLLHGVELKAFIQTRMNPPILVKDRFSTWGVLDEGQASEAISCRTNRG
jgi:hypothetical protein